MSLSKYIQAAMNNVKDYIAKIYPGCRLLKCAMAPLPTNYMPELDVTPKLDADKATFFLLVTNCCSLFVCELGWITNITEVSALFSHLALHHEGHMEAVFHVFAYPEHQHNANYPAVNLSVFKQCDWKEFYGYVEETVPLNALNPMNVILIFVCLLTLIIQVTS